MRENPTTRPSARGEKLPLPYPPSFFDQFSVWVEKLPGPPWAFYVILSVSMALSISAIQWREGAYSAGTFNAGHLLIGAGMGYVLGLMHYLDRAAAAALASFRPLLHSKDSIDRTSVHEYASFDALAYRLTTLPRRPALLITFAGAAFASITFVADIVSGGFPPYLIGSAGTALSTASLMIAFIPANGLAALIIYHTIHQLSQINRIYTQHTRIDIYQVQPLYALSLPGAFTAIGIAALLFVLTASSPASTQVNLAGVFVNLAFIVTAAATFVFPLVGAHHALVVEKQARLAEASSRLKATFIDLHRQLDTGRLEHLDQLNRALAGLQIEQDLLHKIPTWPWAPGAVRAVVAALLLPVGVWAIQQMLARVLGK